MNNEVNRDLVPMEELSVISNRFFTSSSTAQENIRTSLIAKRLIDKNSEMTKQTEQTIGALGRYHNEQQVYMQQKVKLVNTLHDLFKVKEDTEVMLKDMAGTFNLFKENEFFRQCIEKFSGTHFDLSKGLLSHIFRRLEEIQQKIEDQLTLSHSRSTLLRVNNANRIRAFNIILGQTRTNIRLTKSLDTQLANLSRLNNLRWEDCRNF